MSSGSGGDSRPAEERAEDLMERLSAASKQRITWFIGRAREEIEDVVAEAREVNQRQTKRRRPRSADSSRSIEQSRR